MRILNNLDDVMNQRRRLYLRFGNAHNSQVNPENVEEQDY